MAFEENLFGASLGNYENDMEDYEDFNQYTLREFDDGAIYYGKPVMGDPYSFEVEENGKEKTVHKFNLNIVNEEESEYLQIGITVKKEGTIQENVRKGSVLYDLIISLMELETPNIRDQYNLIEKVDLAKIKEFLKTKEELKIKVVERTGKYDFHSFIVMSAE